MGKLDINATIILLASARNEKIVSEQLLHILWESIVVSTLPRRTQIGEGVRNKSEICLLAWNGNFSSEKFASLRLRLLLISRRSWLSRSPPGSAWWSPPWSAGSSPFVRFWQRQNGGIILLRVWTFVSFGCDIQMNVFSLHYASQH